MSENKIVHISQFYPCTKIGISVELAYLVELGKYLHDKGYTLSVDGIMYEEDLKESRFWDYFRMGVSEGWITDVIDLDNFEIDMQFPINYDVALRNVRIVETEVSFDNKDFNHRKEDADYNYRTPLDSQVVFKDKSNNVWLWDLGGQGGQSYMANNKTLNSDGSDTCWISLIAYVAVERLLSGKSITLLIDINNEIANTPNVLSSLLLLQDETNVCKGWCFFHMDENIPLVLLNHLGYAAWFYKGIEKGYLQRWYSPIEKHQYMNKLDMKVGDVVSLYERNMGQRMNTMKSIAGFRCAIIRSITDKGITLEALNTKKTKYQGVLDYKSYSMATKKMYDFQNPFLKLNTSTMTLQWNEIGVEYMMYGEKYFITPLYEDDFKVQNVQNDKGDVACLRLPAIDVTYWILKDFNADFNEDRFLDRYFRGRKPLYTQFYETGTVSKEYMVEG